jgi:hypothetical protein
MNSNPAKNDWELRFGNERRRIDRDLLAEAERQIAREERLIPDTPNPTPPRALNGEELNRIARAFGRLSA